MKLSTYAKQLGISYQTAWRLFKDGKLNAYQLPTGTVIVREEESQGSEQSVAIYCRVSSSENKGDLETLLNIDGRDIEVVKEADNGKEDLLQDLVSIITSFCARLCGQRGCKRKTEKIIQELTAGKIMSVDGQDV